MNLTGKFAEPTDIKTNKTLVWKLNQTYIDRETLVLILQNQGFYLNKIYILTVYIIILGAVKTTIQPHLYIFTIQLPFLLY